MAQRSLRVLFPTRVEETDATGALDADARSRDAARNFSPKLGRYPVVHRNLANVHQRVARHSASGRPSSAGDCAHVNNPLFGGLGLNFGIHDATQVVRAFAGARAFAGEARGAYPRPVRSLPSTAQYRIRAAADDAPTSSESAPPRKEKDLGIRAQNNEERCA